MVPPKSTSEWKQTQLKFKLSEHQSSLSSSSFATDLSTRTVPRFLNFRPLAPASSG